MIDCLINSLLQRYA